ncbi:MAG: trigger factor [Gammaproteobacteria bacterium]|nr:trigger factor [Gammaproteobacteria bacterium]
MQVSLEQADGLERRLRVEVPEQRLATQIQKRLVDVARTARIDGFRPGKAPTKVIERQFGARIRNEVVSEVLRTSFTEALEAERLRPVAEPVIDPFDATAGAGLSYTATFEVFPEIVLPKFETLTVARPLCEINASDLDKMIGVLREQNKTWIAVERPAQRDDQTTLDFDGTLDGESFAGGKAENFTLVLGSNRMINGFEEGLLGSKAGDERILALAFPADYHKAELAGKPVSFKVAVKQVAEPMLPALDESFFEKFGVHDGGLEAFRREVHGSMERERDRAVERRFSELILERVREASDFHLPRAMVQTEVARLQQEMRRNFAMRGVDTAQMGLPDPALFESQANKRVKLGLLMAEIIKTAGIVAQPAKVRARVEAMAASYEHPDALVKWYYEDPQRLHEIEGLCLEDEAVKWIADRTQVTDAPVSFDALMNPGQTASQPATNSAA